MGHVLGVKSGTARIACSMSKHAEELKALKALRGSLETLRNLSERISIDIETAVENRSYITGK